MSRIRLITVGLSDYTKMAGWKIEEAASSRAAIELALRRHGIEVEDWTPQATTMGIGRRLECWAKRADESQIVYWVGHGEYSDHGYHLALADSYNPLQEENSLPGARLQTNLRNRIARRADESGDGWVLLILDTCGSFEGSWAIYRKFDPRPVNVGVIGTSLGGGCRCHSRSCTICAAFGASTVIRVGCFPTVMAPTQSTSRYWAAPSGPLPTRRGSHGGSHRTHCAIATRRGSSKAASIPGSCKSCSVTSTSPRPPSTPT